MAETGDGNETKASIKDVAEAAGVSLATVSLALNGKGRISAKTRQEVQKVARTLGFIPNRAASRLRSGKSALVALIIPDISNPFYAEFSASVEKLMAERGLLPVLANTGDSTNRQAQVLETMMGEGVAGFIISAADGSTDESFALLRRMGAPYVLCVRDIGDNNADFIGFDNSRAGRIAGRHLAERGHKGVAFVGGVSGHLNFRERVQGLREGLGDGAKLHIHEGLPNRTSGMEGVETLLATHPEISAVACFNDLVAAGAYAALSAAGRTIGRDIAVIGFDNIPETSAWTPPLTTVELYPRELGARAAKALLERIDSDAQGAESILIAPRLISRRST
jgi:DNA-binding LacI/PurR family transcriptional regulator